MPLAEEMLVWTGLNVPGGLRLPNDAQIRTTCPTCDEQQALSEAAVTQSDETIYECRNGCQAILIIGLPGDKPWAGRGYRMGDWVLRNPADLVGRLINQSGQPSGQPIVFPASPAALQPESEAPDS